MNAEALIAVETMSLEQIQAELRMISGTPYRSQADVARRRDLWRRLDHLVREAERPAEAAE
jgi:hypothetical protein